MALVFYDSIFIFKNLNILSDDYKYCCDFKMVLNIRIQ